MTGPVEEMDRQASERRLYGSVEFTGYDEMTKLTPELLGALEGKSRPRPTIAHVAVAMGVVKTTVLRRIRRVEKKTGRSLLRPMFGRDNCFEIDSTTFEEIVGRPFDFSDEIGANRCNPGGRGMDDIALSPAAYATVCEHDREDRSRERVETKAEQIVPTLRAGTNELHPADFALLVEYLVPDDVDAQKDALDAGKLVLTGLRLVRVSSAPRREPPGPKARNDLTHSWAEVDFQKCPACGFGHAIGATECPECETRFHGLETKDELEAEVTLPSPLVLSKRICHRCGAQHGSERAQKKCRVIRAAESARAEQKKHEEAAAKADQVEQSEIMGTESSTFSPDLDWFYRVYHHQVGYRSSLGGQTAKLSIGGSVAPEGGKVDLEYTDANVAAFRKNRRIHRALSRIPWRLQQLLAVLYEDSTRRPVVPLDDAVEAHSAFYLMRKLTGGDVVGREELLEEAEELEFDDGQDEEFTVEDIARLARCSRQHAQELLLSSGIGEMKPTPGGESKRRVVRKSELVRLGLELGFDVRRPAESRDDLQTEAA